MQPGLARAVPMGILGFLLGILLVALLRALQSIDPVWDTQLALTMAAFTTSGFFIWGMGAANPTVNAHPHEPEADEFGLIVVDDDDDHDHHDDIELETRDTFGYSFWTISFWTILLLVFVFGLATISGGPALQVSEDPGAEPTQIANNVDINFPILGEMVISQFAAFALFTIFTLVSLAVAGGGIGLAFVSLFKGVKTAEANEPEPTLALLAAPAPERKAVAEAEGIGQVSLPVRLGTTLALFVIMLLLDGWILKSVVEISPAWVRSLFALGVGIGITYAILRPVYQSANATFSLTRQMVFWGLFFFLYWAFWYVLIYYALLGLDAILGMNSANFFVGDINVFGVFTIKMDTWFDFLNTLLTFVNAVGIAITIAYPGVITRAVGRGARGLARWLRGAPAFLGQ